MTGADHYREAERLIVHTEMSVRDRFGASEGAECARQQIAMAQVHATLALAAAFGVARAGEMPALDSDQWMRAGGVQ